MATRGRPPTNPGGPSSGGAPALAVIGLLLAGSLELLMGIMLFGAYVETMGMMSDVYLCDLPAIGVVFCHLDEEMSVSHLLALLLAIFSIAVPIAIWSEVIRQRIYEDPQVWFAKKTNRIYAVIALGVYALVFALETVNLYTLIAKESAGGPFQTVQPNALMAFLADNQGLGIFVAMLVAVVNTVLALLTVRAAHALKQALKEDV